MNVDVHVIVVVDVVVDGLCRRLNYYRFAVKTTIRIIALCQWNTRMDPKRAMQPSA